MIKKIFYNAFILIISSISIFFIGIMVYSFGVDLFYTFKNWNHLEKGVILKAEISQSGNDSVFFMEYVIKTNNVIYTATSQKDQVYSVGDKVVIQNKGLRNARILYVNGQKVSKKLTIREYCMIIFFSFIVLIIWTIIKKKMK